MFSNYPLKASKNATEGYFLNLLKGNCKNDIGVKTALKLIKRSERSEEHTSELQSHHDRVCRLLLEKKKTASIRRLAPTQKTSDQCIKDSDVRERGTQCVVLMN